jgi:hypothetical protein
MDWSPKSGFGEIRSGEAAPWLHYVRAVKTASAWRSEPA